jgi:glycerophosphoryl diester phosphodiesterase
LRDVSPNAPSWLTATPIAHRGLHDVRRGVVENTMPAFEAAAARGLAFECDVRLSCDGEVFVFHDATLDRLTEGVGSLSGHTAVAIARTPFKAGEAGAPTLREVLEKIAGRVPIIAEIKSDFDRDMRLADRVAELAAGYRGPLALKSFDPAIVAHFRASARSPGPAGRPCPLGIVAEAHYQHPDWDGLSAKVKTQLAGFLHYPLTRPDFLSWSVADLPAPTPFLLRTLAAMPVLTWTVRTQAQREVAGKWADQIIFEGDITT